MKDDALHDRSRRAFLKQTLIATGSAALPALALTSEDALASGKVSKSTVGYQYTPNGKQTCGQCRMFIPPESKGAMGRCEAVKGPIPPEGWCRLYKPAD